MIEVLRKWLLYHIVFFLLLQNKKENRNYDRIGPFLNFQFSTLQMINTMQCDLYNHKATQGKWQL